MEKTDMRSYSDVVSGSGSSDSESELLCSAFCPRDTTPSPIFQRHAKATTARNSSGKLWRKALNKAKGTSTVQCGLRGKRERDEKRHGTVDCPITISSPETSPPKKKDVSWTCSTVDSSVRRPLFHAEDEPIEVKFEDHRDDSQQNTDAPNLSDSEDSYHRYAGEFYDGDRRTPVFKWCSSPIASEEAVLLLIRPCEENLVATATPRNIAHNCVFMVNLDRLPHQEDVKCDNLGSWRNNGIKNRTYEMNEDGYPELLDEEEASRAATSTYTLRRVYYKNKAAPDLKKYILSLKEYPKLCLIQYLFDGVEHTIDVPCHGNVKKGGNPYTRTKPSVMANLRAAVKDQKPKAAYHQVEEMAGGIKKVDSLSDLPRNRDQASYLRRGSSEKKPDVDSLVILLEQCKRQQLANPKTAFVREVSCAPELRCVMCYDDQLADIVRFCTNPTNFGILGADPTFNLGKFNVTVTTYTNLLVVDRKTRKHPVMIGPLFMHQAKTYDAYNYFFSKMVSLNTDIANVLAFGTDGEEPLFKAMERNMYHAIHLRCFGHFRDNCKERLRALPREVQKEFLDDLFGRRIDNDSMEAGLLDCETEADFQAQLESLKEVWDEREKAHLPAGKQPSFHKYICEKAAMIQDNMLRPIRLNAGLGNPPEAYYNNMPESANKVIKMGVNFRKSEMSEFNGKMEKVIQQQRRDCESAVINRGPYALADEFLHLQMSPEKWFSLNARQRESHLKKFWAEVPARKEDVQGDNDDNDATEDNSSLNIHQELSVSAEESGVAGVALLSLKEIFRQAAILLNKKDSIMEIPFKPLTFMVESDRGRPHYVVRSESGKVTCDDCPRYKSGKICSHSLAVAEKCDQLKNFLTWYKRSSHTLTTTSYVTCDSAPAVGKKSQKPSTSRRKGGRGQAINIVPRPSGDKQVSQPPAAPTLSPVPPPPLLATPPTSLVSPPFTAAPLPSQVPPHYAAPPPVLSHQSSQSQISTALRQVPYPSPMPGQFIVYPLNLCPPQVSICYGCSNSLKPGGQIPLPPHDLVIASNMMRSFQQGGQWKSKQSNVYFHCNVACIRAKQPSFSYCSMPWFIQSMLSDQQLEFLGKMMPFYTLQ